MTVVLLCRHGESVGNRERRFGGHGDTPLTARGQAQAQAAGAALAGLPVTALYSSDLPRALETARIIESAIGVALVQAPELRERSVGHMTGLTFEEAQARYPDAFAALLRREETARPPGGETYAECRERAAAFLDRAVAAHPGGLVVCVSHHITVYHLVRHLLDLPAGESHRAAELANCAWHRLERRPDGAWSELGLNEVGHLGDLHVEPAPPSSPSAS